MTGIADLIRQADERIRVQVNVAAGLAEAAAEARVDTAQGPDEALKAARKALAERKHALDAAQRGVWQLDSAIAHLFQVLPFLADNWERERARLQLAIAANPLDGLADWLNYWFAAASSRRLDALRRLQSGVALPSDFDDITSRLSTVLSALAADDWLPCRDILLTGAAGVRVGSREIPDRPGTAGREPDQSVRENLRLLAARLALRNGLPGQAEDMLPVDGQQTGVRAEQRLAARLALRSRAARLGGRSTEAESLLGQARDLDPRDLDVTVESIAQERQRGDLDGAMDDARAAVEALLSLSDIEGDIGPLLNPAAELWLALAERARDEGDREQARGILDRAAAAAARGDHEIAAGVEELRATVAQSAVDGRRAALFAGQLRTTAGELERARRDYEAAAGGDPPADAEEARVQVAAQLCLADVIVALSRQRPSREVEKELDGTLSRLLETQRQADLSGTEFWSYLTESDLRSQLSRVPGRADRHFQEWAALLAAARAVALQPDRVRSWLTLADAAMTRDLYRVAETAAEHALEMRQDDVTRAGYARALINTGRYAEARDQLGPAGAARGPGDAWRQCARGLIALRLGKADEAVRHFRGTRIDPAWIWAWHSFICALVIMGDLPFARQTSEELMRVISDRRGERSWLVAAAFDARLRGQLDVAGTHVDLLSRMTGPDDVKVLRETAQTRILSGDQKDQKEGWDLLARALCADPRPARVDVWEREDGPVLAALAAEQGRELEVPAEIAWLLSHLSDQPHPGNPVAELHRAAMAAAVAGSLPQAAQAARLTEAVLRAATQAEGPELARLLDRVSDEDGYRTEALSLHRFRQRAGHEDGAATAIKRGPGSELSASSRPAVQLRLPASWLAADSGRARDVHKRELLDWARHSAELFPAADLEPAGYQILSGDTVRASGLIDPAFRYCSNRARALLPERSRASAWIAVTAHDVGIPADLLTGDDTLAVLLTRPAIEVIAAKYYQVISDLRIRRPAPPGTPSWLQSLDPVYAPPLTLQTLARRISDLHGRPAGTSEDDWHMAERLLRQFTEEAAYFCWINRGRLLFGDAMADWADAERQLDSTLLSAVDGRVLGEVVAEDARSPGWSPPDM